MGFELDLVNILVQPTACTHTKEVRKYRYRYNHGLNFVNDLHLHLVLRVRSVVDLGLGLLPCLLPVGLALLLDELLLDLQESGRAALALLADVLAGAGAGHVVGRG